MILFCFVQAKLYVHICTHACVCKYDGEVKCVGHDLNRCTGWRYVCCVNVGERTPPCRTPDFS